MAYHLVNTMAASRWAAAAASKNGIASIGLKLFNGGASSPRPVVAIFLTPSASYYGKAKIGKREIVGYGLTGAYEYFDRMDYPYPAIRFREITGDLIALKEKEKGDWKKLSLEEKKKLYRASFCRTFAELEYSQVGEWKSILGGVLALISTALWMFILIKKYVCGPLPESCSDYWKEKQLAFYIQARVDPIDGLASLYDYEKDEWKPEAAPKWWRFWPITL